MNQPKGVAAVGVFNRDGHMLWGRRKDNNRWTTPAGHLEPGETPHAGALRELHEEAGLHPAEALVSMGQSKGGPKNDLDIHGFHAVVDGKPTTENDPDDEVHAWKWVNVSKGIPHDMLSEMHVPPEKNILLHPAPDATKKAKSPIAHLASRRSK